MTSLSMDMTVPLPQQRAFVFVGMLAVSALAIAQTVERLDPQADFDQRATDKIFDDAGNWREPSPPAEDLWRSIPDETTDDRRFHFGSDSAYEEMQYRNDDRYRNMGADYDLVRPSPLFRYNY